MLKISPDEERMILEKRAEQLALYRKNKEKLLVLQLSFEYERWLQENGAGSTYSTFCDDFGSTGAETFRKVETLRKMAYSLVSGEVDVPK